MYIESALLYWYLWINGETLEITIREAKRRML